MDGKAAQDSDTTLHGTAPCENPTGAGHGQGGCAPRRGNCMHSHMSASMHRHTHAHTHERTLGKHAHTGAHLNPYRRMLRLRHFGPSTGRQYMKILPQRSWMVPRAAQLGEME